MNELTEDIVEALEGRGFSAAEIAVLPPERIFDEYCGWHLGDPHWGAMLRRVYECARRATQERT